MIEKIGLVGFGIMGAEMASRLRDHAYSVLISDSSASAVAEAKRLGYDICETTAEMAELTEVVLMSLIVQMNLAQEIQVLKQILIVI